jgi:ankyrin repeat protein
MKGTFHRICIFWVVSTAVLSARPNPGKYFLDPKAISLCEAAGDGDTSTIARLLADGVDVNVKGRGGLTALLFSLLDQNKRGFEFLLNHGANPNIQLTETFDDLITQGNSVTSFAAMHEDSWYLKEVLKHNGDSNLVNSASSHTPIFSAIFSMRSGNAKLLIGAGSNLNWQDRDGITPLIQAANLNQFDLAYAMLEAGADPTIKDRFGNTVVHSIKRTVGHTLPEGTKWRERVVELLESKGVDVVGGH